jgi:hypothetical protein
MLGSQARLVGIWELVSFDVEYQESGKRQAVFGTNPRGYMIFTAEGRMMTVITSDGRKPGEAVEEKAELLRTMMSYTGMYKLDGDKIITRIDISWNEAWTGTDQERFYRLNGDRLDIVTAWMPNPIDPERQISRGILSWERVRGYL